MSFRNKSIFFIPWVESQGQNANKISNGPLAADSDIIYSVGKNRVVRIVVGNTAIRGIFGGDKATLLSVQGSLATQGIYLEANTEYFISSADFPFMMLSAAALSVELTQDRG